MEIRKFPPRRTHPVSILLDAPTVYNHSFYILRGTTLATHRKLIKTTEVIASTTAAATTSDTIKRADNSISVSVVTIVLVVCGSLATAAIAGYAGYVYRQRVNAIRDEANISRGILVGQLGKRYTQNNVPITIDSVVSSSSSRGSCPTTTETLVAIPIDMLGEPVAARSFALAGKPIDMLGEPVATGSFAFHGPHRKKKQSSRTSSELVRTWLTP